MLSINRDAAIDYAAKSAAVSRRRRTSPRADLEDDFQDKEQGKNCSFSHDHGSGKWLYLKGIDPIGDTPIFSLNHDYGRKGS